MQVSFIDFLLESRLLFNFLPDHNELAKRFDVLSYDVKLPLEMIADFPVVLTKPSRHIRERHLFLEFLHRSQFDPTLPGFIAPDEFVTSSEETFASKVSQTSLDLYHKFLKTL